MMIDSLHQNQFSEAYLSRVPTKWSKAFSLKRCQLPDEWLWSFDEARESTSIVEYRQQKKTVHRSSKSYGFAGVIARTIWGKTFNGSIRNHCFLIRTLRKSHFQPTRTPRQASPALSNMSPRSSKDKKKPPRTVHIDVYCTGSEVDTSNSSNSSSPNIVDEVANMLKQQTTVVETDDMLLKHQRIDGKQRLPRKLANGEF